jgi:uncharacterized repeat protein (TIGR01451 family)
MPVWAQSDPLPKITCDSDPAIFNTGIDGLGGYSAYSKALQANAGFIDAHWQYAYESGTNTGSSNTHTNPSGLSLQWNSSNVILSTAWTKSTSENAQWSGIKSIGDGTVWYRYELELPDDPGFDPGAFNLSIRLNVDNHLVHVFVNDEDNLSLSTPNLAGLTYNTPPAHITLSDGWKKGKNQIFIVTLNGLGESAILVQPTGAPLCAGKLSVTKTTTWNTHVSAGQADIPFDILVANNSVVNLSGAVLRDLLPAGFVAASSTWQCIGNNGTAASCPDTATHSFPFNVTLNHLPPHSSLRFRVLATAGATLPVNAFLTNGAEVSSAVPGVCLNANGSDSCTSSASVFTGGYVRIDKTASSTGPFVPGDAVSYEIALSNADSVAVTGITVTDDLQAQGLSNGKWSCSVAATGGGSASCLGGVTSGNMPLPVTDLPAQSSLVYTVSARVSPTSAAGTLMNAATLNTANGACWNGFGAIMPCTSKAAVAVVKATVPTLDRWAYGGTVLGVLALAAVVARRKRVMR